MSLYSCLFWVFKSSNFCFCFVFIFYSAFVFPPFNFQDYAPLSRAWVSLFLSRHRVVRKISHKDSDEVGWCLPVSIHSHSHNSDFLPSRLDLCLNAAAILFGCTVMPSTRVLVFDLETARGKVQWLSSVACTLHQESMFTMCMSHISGQQIWFWGHGVWFGEAHPRWRMGLQTLTTFHFEHRAIVGTELSSALLDFSG